MSYTALYRKYRPDSFKDVCGQDVIIDILKKSIKNSKVGHAYLFAGTRGTGKTSVAKIFAKALNCQNSRDGEACNECEVCKSLSQNDVDIIEIDAASNNGVDEIREIRNNVKLVPSVGKYKIYIIDEVHMLSMGAFNALLKTLEEPPEHAIFILATTEVYKIPLTILSRCQRFDFKKIPSSTILERLKYIVKEEKKNISDKMLEIIAENGDGSFRDAINLLDQVISIPNVTEETILKLNGNIAFKETVNFFELIKNNDIKTLLDQIELYLKEGKNFLSITEKLIILIRDIMINNSVHDYFLEEKQEILEEFSDISPRLLKRINELLIELTSNLKKSFNQKITFEIYIIYIINVINSDKENEKIISREIISNNINDKKSPEIEINNEIEKIKKIRVNNAFATADKSKLIHLTENIMKAEDYISNKKYNAAAKIILNSKVVCVGGENIILVPNEDFSIEIFYENLVLLEELTQKILKKKYKLVGLTNEEWQNSKKEFINNKKNNIKYEIISEKNDIIYKKKTVAENDAIELFGEDSIERK